MSSTAIFFMNIKHYGLIDHLLAANAVTDNHSSGVKTFE